MVDAPIAKECQRTIAACQTKCVLRVTVRIRSVLVIRDHPREQSAALTRTVQTPRVVGKQRIGSKKYAVWGESVAFSADIITVKECRVEQDAGQIKCVPLVVVWEIKVVLKSENVLEPVTSILIEK